MVHHLVHEITVVAHHNHATLEVAQVLLEHLQGLDVKVVSGLVKYKEVGVRHQHRAKVKAALLATAKLVHIAVLLFGWEKEVLQELRCAQHLAGNGYHLGNVLHHVNHLHLLVKREAILAVVAPFHRLAHLYGSAVWRHTPHEHLYER